MSDELKPVTPAEAAIGYDTDEPNTTGLFLFVGTMLLLFILVVSGVTYYFKYMFGQTEERQLLRDPSAQLADLHARENWNLTHYGIINKEKGQVRLPIDRAMELIAQESAAGKLRYSRNDQAPKKEPAAAAPTPAPAVAGKK